MLALSHVWGFELSMGCNTRHRQKWDVVAPREGGVRGQIVNFQVVWPLGNVYCLVFRTAKGLQHVRGVAAGGKNGEFLECLAFWLCIFEWIYCLIYIWARIFRSLSRVPVCARSRSLTSSLSLTRCVACSLSLSRVLSFVLTKAAHTCVSTST